MREEQVQIKVDDHVSLEAVYHPVSGRAKGSLLALHPHPLYGGSMNDIVVKALITAAAQEGWAGLRINFRGVGASGGRHEGGKGERQDVVAACAWLKNRNNAPLVLSGYSFGALVGSNSACSVANLTGGILVSPPTMLGPMGDWPQNSGALLVIAGSGDPFGPSAQIEAWLAKQGAPTQLKLLDGLDHFWFDHLSALIPMVRDYLQKMAS